MNCNPEAFHWIVGLVRVKADFDDSTDALKMESIPREVL
jgi:hypothetical protein